MHSASAKIDGEPYALRGARTVRGEALGNLFSNAEQGALRLLHKQFKKTICSAGKLVRPRDHISCTLWDIIYTAVYGRRQCSNFARALHLSREFVPAKRICSCEENCRQTYTDWTAVSPKQQKQESLTCFIRFYLTVHKPFYLRWFAKVMWRQ